MAQAPKNQSGKGNNQNNQNSMALNKVPSHLQFGIKVTDRFVLFYQGFLSQFHNSPMVIDNNQYFCCEQWMMASKAKLFNDEYHLKLILQSNTPKDCKQYGRQVKGFNDQIWKQNREEIVYKGNYAKYSQNKELRNALFQLSFVDNGNEKNYFREFVECAKNDKIWGIGLHINDWDCDNPNKWKGSNLLGKAISRVRDDLWKQRHSKNKNQNQNDMKTNDK